MKKILPLLACSLIASGGWAQTTLPYNTGFDNAAGTAGWQKFRKGYLSPYEWQVASAFCSGAPSAPNCVSHDYPVGGPNPNAVVDWFVSPPFNFSGGGIVNSLNVRVFSMGGNADPDDHFGLYLLEGSPDPAVATVTQLANFTSQVSSTPSWATMTNYPIAAKNGTCYIAFKYTAKDNWFVPSLDDLQISGLGGSSCNSPSAILLSNVTSSGAKVTWSAVTGSTGYEYAVNTTQAHPAGAGTPSINLSETVGGLKSSTKYYAHARAKCGPNMSPWMTVSFNTAFPNSVSDVNAGVYIGVYPNPFKDVLRITGLTAGMTVSLLDITGRLLAQQVTKEAEVEIQTDALSSGVILVNISNEQFSYKTRIVKE